MTVTAPGVTTGDSFNTEVNTFNGSVLLNSLHHILAASWSITARIGQHRGNYPLVKFNRNNQHPPKKLTYILHAECKPSPINVIKVNIL